METLVSIIVPVYNVELYLNKCVSSIIQQTYDNFEIILVDDGSTDGCGQMCDQFAACDERIQVIHQNNKGLSEARNHGIEVCKGSYILFVDGDDYIESNTVEYLIQACKDTYADVVCCGYYKEYKDHIIVHSLTDVRKCYEGEELKIASMKEDVFRYSAWNKIWNRKLFNDCRFPSGRYFEDISTTWKLFRRCHRVTCIPDILFHYIIRKDSISNTKNMKNFVDRWIAFKERFDAMASEGEEFRQICTIGCLDTIGYTWRWLYVVDRKDKERHEGYLQEMRKFLKENLDSVRRCSIATRISLFCAMHSNPVTVCGCYYLNQIYRSIHGFNRML